MSLPAMRTCMTTCRFLLHSETHCTCYSETPTAASQVEQERSATTNTDIVYRGVHGHRSSVTVAHHYVLDDHITRISRHPVAELRVKWYYSHPEISSNRVNDTGRALWS